MFTLSNPRFTFYHRSLPSFQLSLDLIPPRQVLERRHGSDPKAARKDHSERQIPDGFSTNTWPKKKKNRVTVEAAPIWVPFPGGHWWFELQFCLLIHSPGMPGTGNSADANSCWNVTLTFPKAALCTHSLPAGSGVHSHPLP